MKIEKIVDKIYINNSKLLLLKMNANADALFQKGNPDFINKLNFQMETYEDYNYKEKLLSIMPNTATKAEFILSNSCNLNCIYCYSSISRGNSKINQTQAYAVIDKLIANAILKNYVLGKEKKISISFHGGGEPSCEYYLMKEIVEYAQNIASKYHAYLCLEITTNLATKNYNILDFFLKNDFFVHISMDGIESVQNRQRPYLNGEGSFSTVVRNIKYLSLRNAKFSIRLTVTDFSAPFIKESVRFIKEEFPNIQFIKLAPLEITSKSQRNLINSIKLNEYIRILEEIDSINLSQGNKYYSIFGEADSLINGGMCASVRFEQIIVAPPGIISTCHEEPLSEKYCYGTITEKGEFEINNEKISMLKKERLENIVSGACSKCAFRLLCMGGCKHRMSTSDKDMFCCLEKYILTKHAVGIFSGDKIEMLKLKHKHMIYRTDAGIGELDIVSLRE